MLEFTLNKMEEKLTFKEYEFNSSALNLVGKKILQVIA